MRTWRSRLLHGTPAIIATLYLVTAVVAHIVFAADESTLMRVGAILSAVAVLSLLLLLVWSRRDHDTHLTRSARTKARGGTPTEQAPQDLNKLFERFQAQVEKSLQMQISPMEEEAASARQGIADLRMAVADMDRKSIRLQIWATLAGIVGGFLLNCSSLLPFFSH